MGDVAGCRRVARPAQRRYVPSRKEHADAWSRLLSKIDSSYTEARDRLAVRARPVTLSRFLDAGVCIGLLDPVSNIIANTICTSDSWPDHRSEVLSGAVVDEKLRDMGRRSLQGLIAFLIYFFPYLAEWEAVRYLLLGDADLLAAARFIVADRGMLGFFSLNSPASLPAFEAALTLAAQIANHPQPKHCVHVWMLLSSRLHQAIHLLSDVHYHSPRHNLESFKSMLDDPVVPSMDIPWDLSAYRLMDNPNNTKMPYQHTRSLRMVLLDTIHGFYLQALAMLPRGELRSHLHRSLLKAGYCYGPLDPVSNIIYNTIWYHANFPAAVTPVLDVIAPDSLTRLESRSFYGLVSFLLTRYNDLSEHLAVRSLVRACGQLPYADPMFISDMWEVEARRCRPPSLINLHPREMFDLDGASVENVEQKRPCASLREAYMAAATAAWHPNPEEQATFLTSWDGDSVRNQVTSEDVQRWSYSLSPKHSPTPERICKSSYHAKAGKIRCDYQQRRISKKVKAALDRHLLQDGKPTHDLHIITCVNESVCGPEYCEDVVDSLSPYKYRYSHVNFLATQKGSLSSACYPTLFFAEFDNEKEDIADLLCCPVNEPMPLTEHVRCLYCEAAGARVVHPTLIEFHGGGSEFEEVIRGQHSLTNAGLICKSDYAVERMCALEEDFMYVEIK